MNTKRPSTGGGARRGAGQGRPAAGREATPVADGLAADLLNAAVAATAQLLTFTQPADAALSAFFRARKSGARDRAFIAETAYAVLRRKRLLERLAACGPEPRTGLPRAGRDAEARRRRPPAPRRISPRELVLLSLSRVRGMSQRQLEGALMPGEAEWLAEIRRQPEPELTLAEQLDFPDWLVERLAPRMSAEDLLALARALNTPAPLDLRVNTLKAEPMAVVARLAADGIVATPTPYSPSACA
jgi:16S rRNA (cytosine967-C5)-methyltransferase